MAPVVPSWSPTPQPQPAVPGKSVLKCTRSPSIGLSSRAPSMGPSWSETVHNTAANSRQWTRRPSYRAETPGGESSGGYRDSSPERSGYETPSASSKDPHKMYQRYISQGGSRKALEVRWEGKKPDNLPDCKHIAKLCNGALKASSCKMTSWHTYMWGMKFECTQVPSRTEQVLLDTVIRAQLKMIPTQEL